MKSLIWGVLLVVAFSAAPRATMILPADLGELSRDARAIPRGRVVAVESRWTENRRGIESLVTLEAETYLKGQLGGTVRFRVPGGTIGRFRSVTVGAPEFAVGQHVIVFLGARGPSVPYVLGMGQGVYRLTQDRRGAWVVTPPPVLPSATSSARPTRIVRGDPGRVSAPLADFERRVRSFAVTRP
jgi:hypothetical protein